MIGGILLAAGKSLRFGGDKQSAIFRGESLLRRAATLLLDAGLSPRVVVLRGGAIEHAVLLSGLDVTIAWNEDAAQGMSTSIRVGLSNLLEAPGPPIEGCLITLCDQPLVTAEHLRDLQRHWRPSGNPIVASAYGGTQGVPALFAASLFGELARLSGDRGAGFLIRTQKDRVTEVSFPPASVDIDLPNTLPELEA